jgi:hypothetical protein
MDSATIRALRNLLLIIYAEQKSDWSPETQNGRKPSAEAQELYNQYCSSNWHRISEKEFEKLLTISNGKLVIDFSETKAILVLPPLQEDQAFVPILNLECELSKNINSLRLHVLLVRLDEDHRKLYGIGFRCECPENEQYSKEKTKIKKKKKPVQAGEGLHDFYHAQLITGFSYGPSIEIPDWLPTSQPSFPLLADDPVTLVFALLMTLYGKKYCWDFYNKHASNLPDLNPRIKRLQPWIKWKVMRGK